MSEEKPLSQSEAEELKEKTGQEHPGKVPGEGAGPAEATPTGSRSDDPDSEATGAGPSGGADTGGTTVTGDSEPTGAGPSGGADTGGGGSRGGGAEGAGPSGGA